MFHQIPGIGRALYTMKECATEIAKYELYQYPKATMAEFEGFHPQGIRFHLYKQWRGEDREFIKEIDLPYSCLTPYAEDETLYEPEYQFTGPTEEMKKAKMAHEEAARKRLADEICKQNQKLREEEYARYLVLKKEVDRLSERFERK